MSNAKCEAVPRISRSLSSGAHSRDPLAHPGYYLSIVQHRRQLMQLRVAKTLRLDRLHGREHIVAIVSGTAMALLHVAQLFGQRQPPGILDVAAIDHIG